MDDLKHLTGVEIKAIHDNIIKNYGGLSGSRADLSIDTAVFRIHTTIDYSPTSNIEDIAALYVEAVAKGHFFNDGNKRTALVSMLSFLDLNGYKVQADNIKIADKIVEIAEGSTSRINFAVWLKSKIFKT